MKHVLADHVPTARDTAWEPCCNRGFMAKPMGEYFSSVYATDIFDYGWTGQRDVCDFLFHGTGPAEQPDWVFANPPFRLAEQFISRSVNVARRGFAMLVRSSFLEGGDRYRAIFKTMPPTIFAPFVERVIMHKGVLRDPSKLYWDPEAVDPKTGEKGAFKRPSTATSYCWLTWLKNESARPPIWIPPCRRELERPGDYDLP